MFRKLFVLAVSVLILCLGTGFAAAAKQKTSSATSKATVDVKKSTDSAAATLIETQKDKVSYSIGYDIGNTLKKQNIDVDTNILLMGIEGAINNYDKLMTDEQMQQAMNDLRSEMQAKRTQEQAKQGEANKKAGDAYLAKKKLEPGVKATLSGLLYKVVVGGKGAKPKSTDTVQVNYRGTTIDGKEFDSSYTRGVPATFPVTGVIKGWTEALQLMRVGSKWELYIPSSLAYGERGAGESIGPNATLVFTVELLGIQKPEGAGSPAMAAPRASAAPKPAAPKIQMK